MDSTVMRSVVPIPSAKSFQRLSRRKVFRKLSATEARKPPPDDASERFRTAITDPLSYVGSE